MENSELILAEIKKFNERLTTIESYIKRIDGATFSQSGGAILNIGMTLFTVQQTVNEIGSNVAKLGNEFLEFVQIQNNANNAATSRHFGMYTFRR